MKLFFYFTLFGFANTYLIGPDDGGDAILIDPGTMNKDLLSLIEQHHYYVRSVLITHDHDAHVRGITTLKKIYNADIYAHSAFVKNIPARTVRDGGHIETSGIDIEVIEVPGHSSDSLVYHLEGAIFTGDVLAAGRVGGTENSFSRALLLRSIRERLYGLPNSTLIFPGHGPPSSMKAEKMYNPELQILAKGIL